MLVPPAQANKVREVSQQHLVALAPGLRDCHGDSHSATLAPHPPYLDHTWEDLTGDKLQAFLRMQGTQSSYHTAQVSDQTGPKWNSPQARKFV